MQKLPEGCPVYYRARIKFIKLIPKIYENNLIRVKFSYDHVTEPILVLSLEEEEYTLGTIILFDLTPEDLTHLALIGVEFIREDRLRYINAITKVLKTGKSHVI